MKTKQCECCLALSDSAADACAYCGEASWKESNDSSEVSESFEERSTDKRGRKK